ncbi:TadE/TadG family type IV pilus assembly protein [Nocardioides astragali]|nr:TadE family protein [Nocardioides astragali]
MLRSRTHDERGAAAVEFALVSMVLMTLILMIIQMSLWMWAYQVASHAAREGARAAAVNPCTTAATTRAVNRVGGAGTSITAVFDPVVPTTAKVGDDVTVRVRLTARAIAPGLLPSLPQITKRATARIENIPAGGC